MKTGRFFLLLFFFLLVSSGQVFADDCGLFSKKLDSVYGFKPSQLTAAGITAKSAKLDEVWKAVREDQKNLKPCLMKELGKRKDDGFFRYNASNLLYDLEPNDDVKRLMIETYAGVDLKDINPQYWLPYMSRFGFEGFDTTPAAEAWLQYPEIRYYLPQHGANAMTNFKGSLCLYGSVEEKFAVASLIRMTKSFHPVQRLAGFSLLSELAADEADDYLREAEKKGLPPEVEPMVTGYLKNPRLIEPRLGQPKTSRIEFLTAINALVAGNPMKFIELTTAVADGEKDLVRVMGKEDLPLLRKARRYMSSLATPHSTEWHKSFTDIINTIRLEPKTLK